MNPGEISNTSHKHLALPAKIMPPGWYMLMLVCAICGAGVWYLTNFTQKLEWVRLVAGIGICSMLALVIWTWQIT
jgi:hypothetical protein